MDPLDSYFTTPAGHAGVTFVAAAGDSGAWSGPIWPASSPNVLAVGGSTLHVLNSAGTYSGESSWSGSGGGYSSYENEPAFQNNVNGSGARTTPDVAYDASPSTGFSVYNSVNGGWLAVGGTSAGAPQWAALTAIADQGRALEGQPALDGPSQTLYALYATTKSGYSTYATYFHDLSSGSNGYHAGRGYDLVTGLGSPRAPQIVGALVNATGSGLTISLVAPTPAASTATSSEGSRSGTTPNAPASPAPSAGHQPDNTGSKGQGSTPHQPTKPLPLPTVPFFILLPSTNSNLLLQQSVAAHAGNGSGAANAVQDTRGVAPATLTPLAVRPPNQNPLAVDSGTAQDSTPGGAEDDSGDDSPSSSDASPDQQARMNAPQTRAFVLGSDRGVWQAVSDRLFMDTDWIKPAAVEPMQEAAPVVESEAMMNPVAAVLGLALVLSGSWGRRAMPTDEERRGLTNSR
jgi:hypothetical protein